MRISDWSSDVCSSDLGAIGRIPPVRQLPAQRTPGEADRVGSRSATHSRRMARTAGPRQIGAPALTVSGLSRSDKVRSEEHTSELQSLMRISYADFCLNKKNKTKITNQKMKRKVYIN